MSLGVSCGSYLSQLALAASHSDFVSQKALAASHVDFVRQKALAASNVDFLSQKALASSHGDIIRVKVAVVAVRDSHRKGMVSCITNRASSGTKTTEASSLELFSKLGCKKLYNIQHLKHFIQYISGVFN